MKKVIVLFLVLLLCGSTTSAGIFDWISGRAVGETEIIQEEVKCVFADSSSEQKCYTDDGIFECSSATTCIVKVSGEKGKVLRWKSSCGSEVSTTIDGIYEYAEFKCSKEPIPILPPETAQPTVQPVPASPSPEEIKGEYLKEKVQCDFIYSTSEQKCFTEDGRFGCSGVTSCTAEIGGERGRVFKWKGSCPSGYADTVIDGVNQNIKFSCEQTGAIVEIPAPVIQPSTPPSTSIPTDVSVEVKEENRCVFKDSGVQEKCYTSDGRFSCSGIGRCNAVISGKKGIPITWGSSCGGFVYTISDGNSEDIEFYCGRSASTPSSSTRDKVKLHYFYWENDCPLCKSEQGFLEQLKQKYPRVEYDSYRIDNASGRGYTYFVVSNLKTGMPTIFLDDRIWVGYGSNIAAEIENKVKACIEKGCSLTPPSPTAAITRAQPTTSPIPVQEPIMNKVKLYLFQKKDCGDCTREIEFVKILLQNYQPSLGIQLIDISSPDAMNYFSNAVKSLGAEPSGVPTTIVGDKIWVGYNDNIAAEIEKEVKECIKGGCRREVVPAASGYKPEYNIQPGYNIKPEYNIAKEQDECIFWNSDVLTNPHTANPEKCFSDDGRFGCVWTGEVVEKETERGKSRYAHCIAEVSGAGGTQLVWKSSCGGYAYTIIDGNNEAVEFKCIPSSEVREEQITGKGFKRAYWQCYDGIGQKPATSVSAFCKSFEEWQKEAKEFCGGHCYPDGSKCGVNSFSVTEECYPGSEDFPAKPEPAKPEETERLEDETLICKDSCPLNGKCYLFGYRKGGKYCSDQGTFIGQLKEDSVCENSFECETNVCIDGRCISSGLIKKVFNWLKRLFVFGERNGEGGGNGGREEKREEKVLDCGASSDCMENSFKVCKPAKLTGGSGPLSEIVGLEDGKCVLKVTAGRESMRCKIEDYELGTKNLGPMIEKYCEGELVKNLGTFQTRSQVVSQQPVSQAAQAKPAKPGMEIQSPQTEERDIQRENIHEPAPPSHSSVR